MEPDRRSVAGSRAVKLEAPPPRQRVIERDGRLVVIDSGAPAPTYPRSSRTPESRARKLRSFEPTSFDGRGVLTTRAWYDLKGPRRLALDSSSGKIARIVPLAAVIAILALIAMMIVFPWGLVAIPALIQPKAWQKTRARITEGLDRFPVAPAGQA